jgi:hypothetical protein
MITKDEAPLGSVELDEGAYWVGGIQAGERLASSVYAHNPIDSLLEERIRDARSKLVQPAGLAPGTRAVLWDSRADHLRHALELAVA